MQNNIKYTNYIKIQDGCSQHCAYCAIRMFRGPSISEPYESIYKEVEDCVKNKRMQFLQLEGINTVEYHDDKIGDLPDLLEQLVKDFPDTYFNLMHMNPFNIARSMKVMDVLSKSPTLFNTCLFSTQSGCDNILNQMHRPYKKEKLIELFKYAHEKGIEFTTEIIPGFPGETEEEFQETCDFLTEISPATFYINAFSARPGTEACDLPNQLDVEVIADRVEKAKQLQTEITDKFKESINGKEIILINEPRGGLRTIHKIPIENRCSTLLKDNIIIKKVKFENKVLFIED